MRLRLHAWLVILGGLLLAPALLYWAWAWCFDPIGQDDSDAAFRNLAAIPLSEVASRKSVELEVAARSDAQWRRIRRSWGDPDYLVAVISHGAATYMRCFEELSLSVQVTRNGSPVNTTNARCCPYGITTTQSDGSRTGSPKACESVGLRFRIPAGAAFRVRLAVSGNHLDPEAEVTVSPNWKNEKDKMVGLDLDEDIRWILDRTALAGFAIVLTAALLHLRRRLAHHA